MIIAQRPNDVHCLLFPHFGARLLSIAFVAGAISGMAGAFVATPPDLIKTRILSLDTSTRKRSNNKRLVLAAAPAAYELDYGYMATVDDAFDEQNPFVIADRIIKKEGFAVLFSGVHERVLGSIPRFGTTLAMHDVLEQSMVAHGWVH